MLTTEPVAARDCLDCGAKQGMTLQNVIAAAPIGIPLLYVCKHCAAQLTVPPPLSESLGRINAPITLDLGNSNDRRAYL
jgi:hypothetical protein